LKKAFSWLLVQGAINNAARGLCLRNSLSQLFFYFLHAAEAWGISVPQASAAGKCGGHEARRYGDGMFSC
jgi:hypothetical protein